MKKYLAYSVCLVSIISAGSVFAEIKSLIKEYTYQASGLAILTADFCII